MIETVMQVSGADIFLPKLIALALLAVGVGAVFVVGGVIARWSVRR